MPARVLIADDFDQLRRLMRLALEEAGYRVTECPDGAAALRALAAGGFAAAVLDNQMPGLTGAAVVRLIRGWGDHTPVLLVSGSLTAGDLPDTSPPVYLLPKPFEFADLVAAIDYIVGRRPPAAEAGDSTNRSGR